MSGVGMQDSPPQGQKLPGRTSSDWSAICTATGQPAHQRTDRMQAVHPRSRKLRCLPSLTPELPMYIAYLAAGLSKSPIAAAAPSVGKDGLHS